jgi:hypothetical protein
MYASWKVSSTFWLKSWSVLTWIMEPCRSEVSVLWVDWVEYTRTRARAGSGSSRRFSSTSSSAASIAPTSLGELLVALAVLGQPQLLDAERPGGPHRGARPVDRMEPGEREPGLIPQEHQVGLDGQALLHHPLTL